MVAADPGDYRAQHAVGRCLDRLATAYESAGQMERAIESAREAATTLATLQLHDPLSQSIVRESGLAFVRLGRLYQTRAAGRNGTQAAADWRGALAAYERASTLFGNLSSAMQLTPVEREAVQSIPGSLQACRSMLAPRP